MSGILAIWNDIAPEGREHFERWYNREHLQERVGVPGFRRGRRYEIVAGGDRRFFAFYEVDSPAVLISPAYLQRLENPTLWTQQSMRSFRGMVRTVCDLQATRGDLIGAYAVVLRADGTMAPTPAASALIEDLAVQDGVARVQAWIAAAQQTRADTAEMKLRGQDQAIAGAFVVECVRRSDAERVARTLATPPAALGISAPSVLGIYALLCIATSPLSLPKDAWEGDPALASSA
ncbi:MAG: hypothetical protein K2X43_12010 [Hyphomonadaceae bacterium]|jgi:hypothetical protein|nr:hypothetical protein [Hyphomonadaceae bacterium]